MKSKLESYLGFARKSGNLIFGAGTCEISMDKGKVKLLIITEDTAENTRKKLIPKAERLGIPYIIYGLSDEISRITGTSGRTIFAITDKNFANVITEQIESEKKEVL